MRIVYHIWHNESSKGRIGYYGADRTGKKRLTLVSRKNQKDCVKLYRALNKHPLEKWHVDIVRRGFLSDKAMYKAEMYEIKKHDSKNRGYNCTDGGEGLTGFVHSEATKRRMSKIMKGNKNSLGRKLSEATKKLISKIHKGKKVSKASRKRMSEAQKGRRHTIASRKLMSEARRGVPWSDAHYAGRGL
jgi:group I intron endonuclease